MSRNSPLIVLPIRWLFQMLVNFPLCFVAFGRIGTHVQKYTPFRSPSASRLSKNLLRIKFIWLNFYTMKFSRFRFSVLLNVIILTQPVNIVKRFFLFHQVFIKSMENFRRCCFATAWLLYQTAYALSRTFSNFFRTFSSQPIRFRVAVREKPVCSPATAWLYYHSLVSLSIPFLTFLLW